MNISPTFFSDLHAQSMHNKVLMGSGGLCGCFYCCSLYPSSWIYEWAEEKDGAPTALCVLCHQDTVIHESLLNEDTQNDLKPIVIAMHHRYFKELQDNTDVVSNEGDVYVASARSE